MKQEQTELPDWLDPQDWQDYLEYRKEIKAELSPIGQKRSLKRLEQLYRAGENISDVITQTCTSRRQSNGKPWLGLFPVKNRETKPLSHQDYKPKHEEISEEKRQENLRRLNEMTANVFKMVPGGSKR